MIEAEKLNPCGCGNTPVLRIYPEQENEVYTYFSKRYSYICNYQEGGCGMESGHYKYEEEARDCWNTAISYTRQTPKEEETVEEVLFHEKVEPKAGKTVISVSLNIESGCSFEEGEYILYLKTDCVRNDHIEYVEECIENDLIDKIGPIKTETQYEITLVESGEWEDVFWHGYYEIEKVSILHPKPDR